MEFALKTNIFRRFCLMILKIVCMNFNGCSQFYTEILLIFEYYCPKKSYQLTVSRKLVMKLTTLVCGERYKITLTVKFAHNKSNEITYRHCKSLL